MTYKKKQIDTFHRRLKLLGFKSYADYIKSSHWQKFRKRYWRQKKIKRCYCCNKTGKLSMHHKTYKRLGKEKLTDVLLVCNNCHKQIHALNRGLWQGATILRKKKQKKQTSHFFAYG